MVGFNSIYEIEQFLLKAGIGLLPSPLDSSKHYKIIGGYSGLILGCCSGDSRIGVLFEEEDATFEEVNQDECPICNEER
jgi:hypothetical protein